MKSINRIFLSEDYVTLFFVFGVLLLFLMKAFNAKQLYGYTTAFFTKGFIEKNAEENASFFNYFYFLLHFFCVITLGLTLYIFLTPEYYEYNYTLIFLAVFYIALFFAVKKIILTILLNLFHLKKPLNYLYHNKNGYLYSSCLALFPCLILYQYAFKSKSFLTITVSLLLIFRLFLILKNNKKVLTQHFFYFMLYFCAFELAPLLLIYKTIT